MANYAADEKNLAPIPADAPAGSAPTSLADRQVLFCVTGGIAAFKAAAVVSQLRQKGARVPVVMSRGAAAFVTPLTFQALSGQPVWTELFTSQRVGAVDHVELSQGADVAVVAPATANIIGKLANGIADDPVSTILMGTPAPVLLAPAMESGMLNNRAVQSNLDRLRQWGWQVLGPEEGHLASGRRGAGRMVEPAVIVKAVEKLLARRQDFAGRRVLITAGPTREHIDPVRFLSNPSTGKMGFALAAAAQGRGAIVTLIHGPVNLPPLAGVKMVPVLSAREMYDAVLRAWDESDLLIKTAAVADFRPAVEQDLKIKKDQASLTLALTPNPDILAAAGKKKRPDQVLVGFAAESHETIRFAREKLAAKGADFMVANDITADQVGFGHDTNKVHLIFADGRQQALPLMEKSAVAQHILDAVLSLPAFARPPAAR